MKIIDKSELTSKQVGHLESETFTWKINRPILDTSYYDFSLNFGDRSCKVVYLHNAQEQLIWFLENFSEVYHQDDKKYYLVGKFAFWIFEPVKKDENK